MNNGLASGPIVDGTPRKEAFRKYATFHPDAADFGLNENQWVRFIRENGYDGGDGGLFYGDVHIVYNKLQQKGCMTFSQFTSAFQMLHGRHSGMTRKLGNKTTASDEVDPNLASNMPVLLRETIMPPSCPFDVVQTIIKKVQTFYVTGNYSAAYSALEDARTLWLGEMEAAREAEEQAAAAARKAAEEAAEAEAAAKDKGRRGARGSARDKSPAKAADKSPARRGGKDEDLNHGGEEGVGNQAASPKKRAEMELPLLAAVYFDLASAAVMLSDRQPDVAMTFCQQARTLSLGGLDRRHAYFTAIRLVEGVGLFQKGLYQEAYDTFRELKDMCLDGAGGENAAPDSGAAANNMAACCTMMGGAVQSQAMELYLEARKLLLRGSSSNSDGIAIVMKAIGDLHKARSSKTKRTGGMGGGADAGPPEKGDSLARFLTMVVPPAPPPRPPTPPPPPEEPKKAAGPAASSKGKGGKDDGKKKKKKPKKKKIGPPIPPFYGLTALAIAPAKKGGKKGGKKKK